MLRYCIVQPALRFEIAPSENLIIDPEYKLMGRQTTQQKNCFPTRVTCVTHVRVIYEDYSNCLIVKFAEAVILQYKETNF